MSVNIHLIARRISDNSTVFDATLSRTDSAVVWASLQIDVAAYPDSTGSVFRDMPGHLALSILEPIASAKLLSAFCTVLRHSDGDLITSVFWS